MGLIFAGIVVSSRECIPSSLVVIVWSVVLLSPPSEQGPEMWLNMLEPIDSLPTAKNHSVPKDHGAEAEQLWSAVIRVFISHSPKKTNICGLESRLYIPVSLKERRSGFVARLLKTLRQGKPWVQNLPGLQGKLKPFLNNLAQPCLKKESNLGL